MTLKQTITVNDICERFDHKVNGLLNPAAKEVQAAESNYRAANRKEFENYVLDVLKRMAAPGIDRTREESLNAFERGWAENLKAAMENGPSIETLKPRYFKPGKHLRFDNKLIVSDNLDLEHDLFTLARRIIFSKYLSEFDPIYELGCGSCQNLLLLSDMFPSKQLYGLDWTKASTEIAQLLARRLHRSITGRVFDLEAPDEGFEIKPNSAVITIHSLEQIGTRHEKLISFFLRSKPAIVVHYEPIMEFYNKDNLLDFLALQYSQKRNYLSGYYTALCRLRDQGKAHIIAARRPYLGGVIHESSLVVWRPTS